MRSSRILALSLAFLISVFLAACGGGGGGSKTPTQPLGITSSVLPQATVNVPYTFIVQASGGSGTYTWSVSSGTLPPGLTFNGTTAVLGGTPTAPGVFKFTVQVMDAKNDTASQALSLTVGGAIDVTCISCFANTLTLPAGTPNQPYTASFTATGGIAPYTWCIVEPSNGACDNGSGGALPAGLTINSTTGVISGTPTMAQAPAQFTVQAKDSETTPSIGTALITISIFGVTTASLPSGEIYIPYGNQQMAVAGGTSPYSWCVKEANGSCDNGSGGALPPGITISPSCTSSRQTTCAVSGTPTKAGNYNFTVQVTDSETPPAVTTAAFSIAIAGISNGALIGNYIFDFTGYNNGTPVLMIGAFTADGQGNITAGEIDLNNGTGETVGPCTGFPGQTGPQQQVIMAAPSSTYSIGSSGNGTGTLTLVTSAGTYNFTIAIRLDGSGTLIQNNADPATRGSGSIRVQTPNIGVGQLQANFALGLHGADVSGNRYVAAGQLVMEDPDGDFTGPAFDSNDGGTTLQTTFGGTLQGDVDSFGRGCNASLTFAKGKPNAFAYYIISTNLVELLSTDAVGSNGANLTLWSLSRQIVGATGFNNADLTTPNVLELQAQDSSSSDVTTGLFVGQGSSSDTCQSGNFDTATFTYDENQAGTLSQQQSITGQYCVDKSTGRVTLQNFTGVWASTPPVFYLSGNDPGFVVGTDAEGTSGGIEAQNGSDFSNAAVGSGYWGGTISPAIAAATDTVTALFADGLTPSGNMTGTQYTSAPSGPGGPTNLNYTYSVASTGRGVVQNNGQTVGILYVVAPTGSTQFQSKFVLLPTGNNPVLNIFLGSAR